MKVLLPPARRYAAPLSLTLSALAVASTLGSFWLPAPALAQTPATAANASAVTIAAGPLEDALNQFGHATGILLSFDPALVQGKHSPGVQHAADVASGLQTLLRGSGLVALPLGQGSYRVQPEPAAPEAAGATVLSAIRVTGTTEGSDSYTTQLTNTATKLDLSLRETPQSITVMTHQRLADQGLDEVSKVLDQSPGLYFHNTNVVGGDSNFIYARGFVLDNYQVNGVPRSTRFGAKGDIADTAVYDRVEVVRGASGLLNGIGEPSGAVNLVRKLPTHEAQAHLTAKVGSWRLRRVEADVSGPLAADGRLRGRLVGARQDNDTFIDRIGMRKDLVYGVAELDLTPSTILTAGLEYQRHRVTGAAGQSDGTRLRFSDGSLTDFPRSVNMAADWSHTDRKSLTLFSSLEHYTDNDWRIRVDAEHVRREHDLLTASLTGAMTPSGESAFRAIRYGGKPVQNSLSFHAAGPFELLGGAHELVVGGNYTRMENRNFNYLRHDGRVLDSFSLIATGDYPEADLSATGAGSTTYDWQSGLYATTRLRPMDRVSVILGARLSQWKTRTDRYTADGVTTRGPTQRESSVFTPYAGIVFDVTDFLSLYASYTDIFKPAADYDSQGQLLAPAEGSNIEGGFKLAFLDDTLNLSGAYYRTRKDNVPEYVPGPGGSINYGPTGQYVYRGIDGTRTTGYELEVSGHLTSRWQMSGGYSYANPLDANGNQRLTYIPRRTFKLFTSYRADALLEGLTLGLNLRWQNEISSTDYRQGGVTITDLMAQYRIRPDLVATLNINNVFDKTYLTNINLNNGWYGEPRAAFLNLRYSF